LIEASTGRRYQSTNVLATVALAWRHW
jgi:hypothetical protein